MAFYEKIVYFLSFCVSSLRNESLYNDPFRREMNQLYPYKQ